MKLSQQVVSLPQLAKRLKELGVKQESFFYWDTKLNKIAWSGDIQLAPVDFGDRYISAFTVAELGEMLREAYYSKWETAWDSVGDNWRGSLNTGTTNGGQLIHHWVDADTEADARAKMLIYLIMNNLITV